MSMRQKPSASRTPTSAAPFMAWACLVVILAYLLVPVVHSWGVADCLHAAGEDCSGASECCATGTQAIPGEFAAHDEGAASELDGGSDGQAPRSEPDSHPRVPPHDEFKCQICLTVWMTHGGASPPVDPVQVVFTEREFAASASGQVAPDCGTAMHVRTSRGPPQA
ncbi:MAG: hypothetical protein H7210_05580 [Pyrinomonadaceae bacterium]|nr:hypothetical protein [Phycisphaerales bacterium]